MIKPRLVLKSPTMALLELVMRFWDNGASWRVSSMFVYFQETWQRTRPTSTSSSPRSRPHLPRSRPWSWSSGTRPSPPSSCNKTRVTFEEVTDRYCVCQIDQAHSNWIVYIGTLGLRLMTISGVYQVSFSVGLLLFGQAAVPLLSIGCSFSSAAELDGIFSRSHWAWQCRA